MKKCEFLIRLVGAVVIVLIALGAWAIVSFTVPPPSKRCGTPVARLLLHRGYGSAMAVI
uniref:Uncharacterized protein n=1 Tax=Brassica campestris TaxID=3711 RepID=A0A3P5YFX8_BRACM|nr:unnamed protein product [Brassica rapa]